ISMAQQIKDSCARTFCDQIFRTIVRKRETIETAVLQARSKIKEPDQIGIPVLHTSTISNRNPFVCTPGKPTIIDPLPICHLHNIYKTFEVIRGRDSEILKFVDNVLDNDHKRVHMVVGEPGIGKTTFGYKVAEIISRNVDGGVHGFSFETVPSKDKLV